MPPWSRRLLEGLLLAALCPCALRIAAAQDAGPPMLLPGESVRVPMTGNTETVVAFAGMDAGRFTIDVRATKRSAVKPVVKLISPSGAELDGPQRALRSGRAVRFGPLALTEPGVWRIVVRAPAGADGDVDVRAAVSKLKPVRFAVTTTADAPVAAVPFPGVPRASCTASFTAKPAQTGGTTVRIAGPASEEIRVESGSPQGLAVRGTILTQPGRHSLEAGPGPGRFAGTISVRPAKPRKGLVLIDVESLPDVSSWTPPAAQNDQVIPVRFEGVGLSESLKAYLRSPSGVLTFTPIVKIEELTVASFDLDDFLPGAFTLHVINRSGRSLQLPGFLLVSDRPSSIRTVSPAEVRNGVSFPVLVEGQGMDPDAFIRIKPKGGGAALPLANEIRVDPRAIRAVATFPRGTTGLYDLELVESGQVTRVVSDAIDAFGRTGSDTTILAGEADQLLRSAAFDASGSAVVVAYDRIVGTSMTIQVYGTQPWNLRRELVVSPPSGTDAGFPVCSADPAGGTWCVTWAEVSATTQTLHARVIRQSDAEVLGEYVTTDAVARMCAVPRPLGGYTLIWVERAAGPVFLLRSARLDSVGQPIGISRIHDSELRDFDATASLFDPCAALRPDGNAVVGYLRPGQVTEEFRTIVVASDGAEPFGGPRTIQTQQNLSIDTSYGMWMACDPETGMTLAAWTARGAGVYHHSGLLLGAGDATLAGPPDLALDDLGSPAYVFGASWNPVRGEFVVAQHVGEPGTQIHRVRADGSLVVPVVPEVYEGILGGFARTATELATFHTHDGRDDGRFDFEDGSVEYRTFRFR